jgi:lipopolysaccharide assembly outer membrane protein LptD (OstA)
LVISQSYSLGNPLQTNSNGNLIKGEYFSDIQGDLTWYFNPYLSTEWTIGFNPYKGHFDEFDALITAKDRRNDAVMVQYRNTSGSIGEINFYARVKTIPSLYLSAGTRYNILENWMVDNMVGVEYDAQCWGLGLTFDNMNQSPDGTQKKQMKVMLYFNLLGLGSAGTKPYWMLF